MDCLSFIFNSIASELCTCTFMYIECLPILHMILLVQIKYVCTYICPWYVYVNHRIMLCL